MGDFRVYSWDEGASGRPLGGQKTALTVGVFDGPHRGHRKLINAVLRQPLCRGAVTFAGLLKSSGTVKAPVSTMGQRLDFFKEQGLDFAIVIDFSGNFGKMEGRAFLGTLADRWGMKFLAEGDDFRCGHHGACGIEEISRLSAGLDFTLEVEESVIYRGERISSSRIRDAVGAGDFAAVEDMLGRPYALDCRGWAWTRAGKGGALMGGEVLQALPKDGVYGVTARSGAAQSRGRLEVSGGGLVLYDTGGKPECISEIIFKAYKEK
ncbi:MAG: FAD synthetase family protein [Spirochaetaceae bacterium]|jgi:FAD synthase|nr:FAD synthetase family protein [Spirochaetaceae bacterium]